MKKLCRVLSIYFMNLILLNDKNELKNLASEICVAVEEWRNYNKLNSGENTSPSAIFEKLTLDFEAYLDSLDVKERGEFVPASTFFAYDLEESAIVGAINIRHELNDYLSKYAGHIGYGVRPKYRRKNYATEILRLGLIEARRLNLSRVLLVCDEDNLASNKVIQKNGGVLQDTIEHNGKRINRYWIEC